MELPVTTPNSTPRTVNALNRPAHPIPHHKTPLLSFIPPKSSPPPTPQSGFPHEQPSVRILFYQPDAQTPLSVANVQRDPTSIMSSQISPPQSPISLTNVPVVNVINFIHPRLPLASRAGSPAPSRLLGSGSRKSRLPCFHRRRGRCRCCCGWCSELRGSESRLRPFPAAAMKWMFKEDHSLGKRLATGRAVGAGAAAGPFPHSGRPGLGRAGRMWSFGFRSPRPGFPG